MGIYIIRLRIPSENRTKGYENIDDYTARIHYKFPAPIRAKIASIRTNYVSKFRECVVKFEDGIYIGTDEHVRNVEKLKEEINEKLKKIPDDVIEELQKKIEKIKADEKLSEDKKAEIIRKLEDMIQEVEKCRKIVETELEARLKLLPLDENKIRKGEYYAAVAYAIYHTIIEDILRRINRIQNSNLNEKMKEKLFKVLDNLRGLNFLNDEFIDRRIEELKHQLEGDIEFLKQQLVKELEEIERKRSTMFAYLEI